MSKSFFEIERGLQLENVTFITGAGAPSGTGDSATVGIGSFYLDSSGGELYVKKIAGAGAGNWSRTASASEVVSGTSWRHEAKVADHVSTTVPVGTAGNPIVVDGVSIGDGEYVLFTAITGGSGANEYVYNQASGTFIEDINNESAGDTVYVVDGTSAGRTYNYNKLGQWVWANQASLDEEGYIRAYIGKAGSGSILPTYSSTFYVANGDNLAVAVGKLDTQVKTNTDDISAETTARVNADAALQSELNSTQSGAGLNANGTYSAAGGANYISTANSLHNADQLLDAQLKAVSDDVAALELSDAQQSALLARARAETSALAVTAATTIDSVSVDSVAAAKWIVHVQGNAPGDAANKVVAEIMATHDGTPSADATDTDYSVYAKLKMGNITGLAFDVDVTGVGAAQTMRLRVTSTMSVDVKAIREVIA